MTDRVAEGKSLLHLTRNEIMMRFGIPDMDYSSVMVYTRQNRHMILVLGLEEKNGRLEETVTGYVCGTEAEGAVFVDEKENADALRDRMNLEQLCRMYTVADVGSGTFRPVMIGAHFSIWFIKTDKQGNILELREKKLNAQPDYSAEAEDIYQKLFQIKTSRPEV